MHTACQSVYAYITNIVEITTVIKNVPSAVLSKPLGSICKQTEGLHRGSKITTILTHRDFYRCIRSRSEVIKLFSYSTQLNMKFFLLINVKMPITAKDNTVTN